MNKRNKVFLNEKVAKKLIKNEKYGKILSAKIISGVLEIDYDKIYNSLKISSEEIAFSSLTVNSTADGIYYDDTMYFNIEYNFYNGISKEKQILSYCYQLYLGQLHTYENYHHIKKILQISIDSYDVLGINEFMYRIKLMDEKSHLVYDDSIEFVHINLDFLNRISYNEVEKASNKLMKVLYFLICDDEDKIKDLYGDDELMKKVTEEAKQIAGIEKMHLYLTDEELLKQDQDFYYEKGIKEGIEQGIEQGIKEGIEQGFGQGIEQKEKDIVLNMYKKKLSINTISDYLNLSIKEVKAIIDNN